MFKNIIINFIIKITKCDINVTSKAENVSNKKS